MILVLLAAAIFAVAIYFFLQYRQQPPPAALIELASSTPQSLRPQKKFFATYSPEGYDCFCPFTDANQSGECLDWNTGETLMLNGRCNSDESTKYVGGVYEFAETIRVIANRNEKLSQEKKTRNVILRLGWAGIQINEKLNCSIEPYASQLKKAKEAADASGIKIIAVYLFDEPVWRLQVGGSVNKTNQDRFVQSLACQAKLVRAVLPSAHILVNFAGPLVIQDADFRDKIHSLLNSVKEITHIGFDHYPSESYLSSGTNMQDFWRQWMQVFKFMEIAAHDYNKELFIVPLLPTSALKGYLSSVSMLEDESTNVQALVLQKKQYNLSMLHDEVRYILPWMNIYNESEPFKSHGSPAMQHMIEWKRCVETHDYTKLPICSLECDAKNFNIFNIGFKPTVGICNRYKTDESLLDKGCALKWEAKTKTFVSSRDSTCCVPSP